MVGGRRTHAHRADLVPSAIKRFGVRQVRGWWVVGEEERRPGRRHRAADCRQRRAEERWQPAAAGRQMPAARLTRWRSGRSSFRASAYLRAHRASAIKVAVPGETGRGARHCPADLQLPPRTAELRRRGGCAHLLRRSRVRGGLSWCSTVGCPCEAAGGPAGGIERLLAAPSTSCSEMSSRSPEPPTAMPKCAAPAPPFSML